VTTTALDKIQQQASPGRVGQGTVVEQSRAVAEVEAAIVVALRHPRDVERAVAEMQRSCARTSLAEKAFFRYSRGEGQISGPSVQLARELARCWGNFQSGLVELRRDDDYKQSEMLAFAWDVQTNTRTSTTFIVPHIRDTRNGAKILTDVRDIYEMNANMGARRLREMIFDSLPGWFTEDAVSACYKTLAGGEADLPERITKCTAGFAMLGVTVPMLVRKLGAPADKWTPYDLATLTVIYRSLQRGEIRKEDEFEDAGGRVTAADIIAPVQPVAPPQNAAGPDAQGEAAPPASDPPMRREPVTVPSADGGTGPADSEGPRNQGLQQVRPSDFGKLLAGIPLGPIDDVHVFLSWRCDRKVTNLKEISDKERASIAAYIREAQEAAGNDPEETAAAIWAQYKEEFPPHLVPAWRTDDLIRERLGDDSQGPAQ
jgi:hypothetical protein